MIRCFDLPGGRAAGAGLLAALVLLLAAVPASAAPVNKEEPLFRIEGTAPQQIAADPATGHLFFFDTHGTTAFNGHKVDEYTPWGEFLRSLGTDVATGAVNELQEVRVRAAEGSFTLSFEGAETPDLPYDATGEEVEAALDALAPIGGAGGEVVVKEHLGATDGTTPFVYRIAFKGSLQATDVPRLEAEGPTLGGGQPETGLQARTLAEGTPGGAGLESCTAESGCQGGNGGPLGGEINSVQSLAVSSASGDLYLGEAGRIQQLTQSGHFLRAWGGDTIRDGAAGTGIVTAGSTQVTEVHTTEKFFYEGQPIEGTGIEPGTSIAEVKEGKIVLSQPAGPGATGTTTAISTPEGPNNVPVDETQTIFLGPGLSGTFQLSFTTPVPSLEGLNAKSAPVPTTATAGEVEAALLELPTLQAGDIAVSGPAGGPWAVEFKGSRYGGADVPTIGLSSTLLGDIHVRSEGAEEDCEVAAECQAPEGPGYSLAFSPDGETLYAGQGQRIRRFDPQGADLGDLPDPSGVMNGSRYARAGIANLAASPTDGDLFIDFGGESEAVYELSPAGGALVRKLSLNPPSPNKGLASPGGLAVDEAGNLYAVSEQRGAAISHLVVFGESGTRLAPSQAEEEKCEAEEGEDFFAFCEEALGIVTETKEFSGGLRGLGAGPAGDLYVADSLSESVRLIRALGPPPVSLESPPPAAPSIEAQYAVAVGDVDASVRAAIDPHFFSGPLGPTTFYVRYATAACVEAEGWGAGSKCVKETSPPVTLGGGVVEEAVTGAPVALSGLSPDTEYRYRFVAEGNGAPGAEVEGEEESFHTRRAPGEGTAEGCPNEAFRTGPSAALPDCRAYEMVSPVDKEGGEVRALADLGPEIPAALAQASASGDKLAYGSYLSFGGAESAPYTSQYIATRGPGGWQSVPITPPRGRVIIAALASFETEFKYFSEDLCGGWLEALGEPPLSAEAVPGYTNLYRRQLCPGPGGYEALTTVKPLNAAEKPPGAFREELQGISAGGAVAAFTVTGRLTADAPILPGAFPLSLYVRRQGAPPAYACYLPNGRPFDGFCSAGNLSGTVTFNHEVRVEHALSADGTKLYWAGIPASKSVGNAPPATIYLRENPTEPQSPLAHGAASGLGKLSEGSTAITSLIAARGKLDLTSGSTAATVSETSVGEFLVGQPLSGSGIAAEATIAGCSPECGPAATGLTLSKPATASKEGATISSAGPTPFEAGQTISAPGIPAGTTITAVAAGSLTISQAATKTAAGTRLTALSECTNPTLGCTLPVSQAAEEESGENEASRYWGAAADGSVAVFSVEEGANGNGRLYEYEAAGERTRRIAGGVLGVAGMSDDASRIYFVSREDLAPGASEGQPNLYLRDGGQGGEDVRFVAALAGYDVAPPSPHITTVDDPRPSFRNSRTTADGSRLAFVSVGSLTGYDSRDLQSGEPDAEVYLYDAEAGGGEGKLLCVSCNPSGARPSGVKYHPADVHLTAGGLPSAINNLHESRLLSADGKRLFFESPDALAQGDTNGVTDVYEWEEAGEGGCTRASQAYSRLNEGCVSLISSGKSPVASEFLEADPSGANAFFTTTSSLVPQDPGVSDAYDARVDGGLPPPPAQPAQCEGEACQPAAQAPAGRNLASAALQGPGNLTEGAKPAPRCPKGRHRARRGGRARCVKRHRPRRAHRHHRHRKHHRKGGRSR
jgi:hypothetical protein